MDQQLKIALLVLFDIYCSSAFSHPPQHHATVQVVSPVSKIGHTYSTGTSSERVRMFYGPWSQIIAEKGHTYIIFCETSETRNAFPITVLWYALYVLNSLFPSTTLLPVVKFCVPALF